MMLPPPLAFGLSYPEWYPGQDVALSWVLDGISTHKEDRTTLALSAPTGSGKSVIALLSGLLSGRRTVILTATKGLQDQYRELMQQIPNTADIRGQNAYPCDWDPVLTCEEARCHLGQACGVDCQYYTALAAARRAPVVITNYACWLTLNEYGTGLGQFDLIILDEAHQAHRQLSSFLEVTLSAEECRDLGLHLPTCSKLPQWKIWTTLALPRAESLLARSKHRALEEGGGRAALRLIRRLNSLVSRLKAIRNARGPWVIEHFNNFVLLAPVWPGDYAEPLLFRGIPLLLLMSATLTPKAMDLLRLPNYRFYDSPSFFPIDNRLVTFVPTAKMNHRATDYDLDIWAARIDQIIQQRLDRKGIVHVTSYARRDFLLKTSRYANIMLSHNSREAAEAVNRFRQIPPPAVLISPSITDGWDFPYQDCEYNIIGKVPYPDGRSPIVAARSATDPNWTAYEAMQTLVQASGRGDRSQTDFCETFIIDDDWRWFWKRYSSFAPTWFRDAVRFSDYVPLPPPKIRD